MNAVTMISLESIVTACFFGTWIVLGIDGFFLFYLGKDVAFKRKWFPRYVILAGVLFVVFATSIMAFSANSLEILGMLAFIILITSIISYLNIKMTRFCDKCGATLVNQNWFVAMKFCPKCGAELNAKPKVFSDLLE